MIPDPHRRGGARVPAAALTRTVALTAAAIIAMTAIAAPALANNLGENYAWQFRTSADVANQAAVLDLIEKRRGGFYAAPIYTTNIARQVNCSISATATANSSAQGATANSPIVTGAVSTATGNSNSSSISESRGGGAITGSQANAGAVTSGITGGTSANVQGAAWQALNSDQSNGGNQTANVRGSNACSFGALN